jgi:hypothetical protein
MARRPLRRGFVLVLGLLWLLLVAAAMASYYRDSVLGGHCEIDGRRVSCHQCENPQTRQAEPCERADFGKKA